MSLTATTDKEMNEWTDGETLISLSVHLFVRSSLRWSLILILTGSLSLYLYRWQVEWYPSTCSLCQAAVFNRVCLNDGLSSCKRCCILIEAYEWFLCLVYGQAPTVTITITDPNTFSRRFIRAIRDYDVVMDCFVENLPPQTTVSWKWTVCSKDNFFWLSASVLWILEKSCGR